jgi:uncharacterized protein CbrC (UPF0167 family)
MSETLPFFKYHPNPLQTESIKVSDETCLCCDQKRGYLYNSSLYTRQKIDGSVCPWCIADGSAAKKFEGAFSDNFNLIENRIQDKIIDEVTKRTPSYNSWQQEVWLTHCQDACAFYGDVDAREIKNLDEETFQRFRFESEMKEDVLKSIIESYPYGSTCIYKFVCLHCGERKYHLDFS